MLVQKKIYKLFIEYEENGLFDSRKRKKSIYKTKHAYIKFLWMTSRLFLIIRRCTDVITYLTEFCVGYNDDMIDGRLAQ